MKRSVISLVKWFDRNFEDSLGSIFYVYMTVIIFAEVVRRYVFNNSSSWADETAVYAFIWLSYLSASAAVRTRSHLSFSFLDGVIPIGIKLYLRLFADICFIVVAVLILVTSIPIVGGQIQYGQLMRGIDLPMALAGLAVPVGWSLILFRIIQRSYLMIRYPVPRSQLPSAHLGDI